MEFSKNRYNDITENDLQLFKSRTILFNCSQGSCLEVENAVLTLENLEIFCDKKDLFFDKLSNSKFNNKTNLDKYNLFYRWLLNFLSSQKETDKVIMYIYDKCLLDHLKEASILFVNEEIDKQININF